MNGKKPTILRPKKQSDIMKKKSLRGRNPEIFTVVIDELYFGFLFARFFFKTTNDLPFYVFKISLPTSIYFEQVWILFKLCARACEFTWFYFYIITMHELFVNLIKKIMTYYLVLYFSKAIFQVCFFMNHRFRFSSYNFYIF